MKIQESLINRIENYIKKKNLEEEKNGIFIQIKQAKTTESIYIKVRSTIDAKILLTYRLSHHTSNKTKKTKILTKKTKFDYITRKIDSMIKECKNIKLKILLDRI